MTREARAATPFLRVGSNTPGGIALISRAGEMDPDVRTLAEVLEAVGLAVNIGENDSKLPEDVILVVVGPKP